MESIDLTKATKEELIKIYSILKDFKNYLNSEKEGAEKELGANENDK